MKSRKRIAQFMLAIIAFSIIVSALPGLAAFASSTPDPYNLGYNQKDVAGSLPPKINSFINGDKGFQEAYDKFTDGEDLQKSEKDALRHWQTTDMCDRTSANSGLGHPTFLGLLFKLTGDSPDSNIKNATATYEESQIKPEMVPYTDYDCFPPGWEKIYSEAAWHNFQRASGTFQCGRFDVTCAIEKALRQWISEGIKTGLTWIMNIATGSGSGGDFQACRIGSKQDVAIDNPGYATNQNQTVDEKIDAGFTQQQMERCDAALNNYYALDKPNASKHGEGQLVAIGLKGEPQVQDRESPNYGKFDAPPGIGSGSSTVNSKATTDFFAKSANIGIILAVGMIVGAVIQAMIQQKPQLLFRAIIIQLPLFGIGILAVPIITRNFMAFIDGVSYYLADTSQRDITRVALSIGVNVGDAIANNTAATGVGAGVAYAGTAAIAVTTAGISVAGAPLMASIMQGSLMILVLIGAAFVMQALGLWALMQFREASIVLVIAVIPLSMSASIWPTLTRTANKFIKLLASLIVAKIPIVMALSMGLHFLSDWAKGRVAETASAAAKITGAETMANIPQGGNRVLIMGMAIFCLAFLAPTFVITLFDAIGEMGGSLASRMHSGAGRSGLMYGSQAASLKGMPGLLSGNRMQKAKQNSAGSKNPSTAEKHSALRGAKAQKYAQGKIDEDGGGGNTQGAQPQNPPSTPQNPPSTPQDPGGPQGARGAGGNYSNEGKSADSEKNPWSNKAPRKGEGLK